MPPTRLGYRQRLTLLLIAAAVCYLLGNASVSLWDRDEPRYAQASRQMLQSGDWVVPRFLDELRLKKPVLIYWCQAGAMKLIGEQGAAGTFAARLPSVIAMLATVGMVAIVLRRDIGRRRALWAAFILATSGLSIGAAKMCLTDAVLLLWITAAQLCVYRIWRGRASWGSWIVLGVASGLAILTKGPVVIGVIATTLLVLSILRFADRDQARDRLSLSPRTRGEGGGEGSARLALGAFIAIVMALLVVTPWAIALANRVGHDEIWNTIRREIFERARTAQEGHKGPPGYYLLTVWGTFFPWSLLLPAAAVYAWKHWRGDPLVRFAVAATIGPWVMFEVVQTKLPHYLLPVFPWIAIVLARAITSATRPGRADLRNRAFVRVVNIWAIFVALVAVAPAVLTLANQIDSPSGVTMFWVVAAGLVGVTYARFVYITFRAGRPTDAGFVLGGGMLVLVALFYGAWLPDVAELKVSKRVADVLHDEGATGVGDVIMIDYKEPSLAFYQGGTVREQSDEQYLGKSNPLAWPRWVVITPRVWEVQPPGVKAKYKSSPGAEGWWYASGGRRVEVRVLRKK